MKLQQLEYFMTAANAKSFNKAAKLLLVSQPNLSRSMTNLENELQIRIFERNNKGILLTEDGKQLFKYCQTLFNQLDLIHGLSKADENRPRYLSVASYPITTMSRVLSDFYQETRSQNVILTLTQGRMQTILDAVQSGKAELGFIMSNNVQAKEIKRVLADRDLEFNYLGTDTWFLNVGEKSPFYSREMVAAAELRPYPFVRMPDDYFSNLTFHLELDGLALAEYKRTIYVNEMESVITLLQNTDAFRFGPGLSKNDLEKWGIRSIPLKNSSISIRVGWVRRKKELLSAEAALFVERIEQVCRDYYQRRTAGF